MEFLPISIDELHENTLDCLIVEGTMTKDFGPWKKGEDRTLTFNFEKGTVTEHDNWGVVKMEVNIGIVVV